MHVYTDTMLSIIEEKLTDVDYENTAMKIGWMYKRDVDIIVKLDSKHLIDSLTSDASVKYLTDLAQAFAKKSAETFIKEIQNKKHLFSKKRVIRPTSIKVDRVQNIIRPYKEKNILNEEEAFKLLEKPSPDGDNLDYHTPAELTIEDAQETSPKKGIPVYGLKKVNGIYVRRFLGIFR